MQHNESLDSSSQILLSDSEVAGIVIPAKLVHPQANTTRRISYINQKSVSGFRSSSSSVVHSRHSKHSRQFSSSRKHDEWDFLDGSLCYSKEMPSFPIIRSDLDSIISNIVSRNERNDRTSFCQTPLRKPSKRTSIDPVELSKYRDAQKRLASKYVSQHLNSLRSLGGQQKLEKKYLKEFEKSVPNCLILRKVSGRDKLIFECQTYHDQYACLQARKSVYAILYICMLMCRRTVYSTSFALIMSIIIIFHMAEFIYKNVNGQNDTTMLVEQIIMVAYLIEVGLRIMAEGVVLHKKAFFKQSKNWFDFILVSCFIVHIYYPKTLMDLSALRLLTLLMYLGRRIQGLQVMLAALHNSIKFLAEALMVVALFALFFATVGTSLFTGLINYRCIPDDPLQANDDWIFCRGNTCDIGYHCIYQDVTPNIPTSFNNIVSSFGQVLRTITMDDWTYVMYFTLKTFNSSVWVYYILVIFIGGFFGFNLVIAVLKTHYSEQLCSTVKQQDLPQPIYDVKTLRDLGIYVVLQKYKEFLRGNANSLRRTHLELHKNVGELRLLSGKMNTVQIPNGKWINLIQYINTLTLRNILLPKYRQIHYSQRRITPSQFTDEQSEIDLLQELLSSSVINYQMHYNSSVEQFTSQSDILIRKNRYMPTIIRRSNYTKLKVVFDIESKSKVTTKPINLLPINKHNRLKLTGDSILMKDDHYAKQFTFKQKYTFDTVRNSTKKKALVIKKDKGIYLKINGAYQSFQAVSNIIKQRIPKNPVTISDYPQKYFSIRSQDYNNKCINHKIWSGNNVIPKYANKNSVKRCFNQADSLIWLNGIVGHSRIFRKYTQNLINSEIWVIIVDLIIMLNFVVLILLGIIDQNVSTNIEDFTTIALTVELILRLFAYHPKQLLTNTFFIVEIAIIALNFFELTISSTAYTINDKQLRLMRGTKSVLFYRCLKYNTTAVLIGKIAQKTFKQYIYLTMLMFFAILTYGLIGMEVYSSQFDQSVELGQLHSFDDPLKSWMTIFNIMTNDDWYGVLVLGSAVNKTFGFIYSYSMVFFLNYLTFGLVMAILLDGFGQYLCDEDSDGIPIVQPNSRQVIDTEESKDIKSEEESNNSEQQSMLTEDINMVCLQNSIKKLKESLRQDYLYKDIACEESLFIFPKSNKFRRYCCRLSKSIAFNILVLSLILGSIAVQATLTYDVVDKQISMQILTVINICTGIVTFIQIVAFGLVWDVGCYLDYYWKWFDILYMIGYFIDISVDSDVYILRVLLYLGYLRPMNLLYRVQWLKTLYDALIISLINMINVLITIVIIWIIFAVFGMILFQNEFGYCDNKMNFTINKQECLTTKQQWVEFQHNFNDITQALPTLFVLSTFDGWGEILQVMENSQPAKYGPEPFVSQVSAYLYLIPFCFIGSMFFLSLFTGLLYINLKSNEQKIENYNLTQAQREFISISNIILRDKPQFSNPPTTILRKKASLIVQMVLFQRIIFILLIIDSVLQVSFYHGQQYHVAQQINSVYTIITIIFGIWVTLLLLSYGFNRFIEDQWRQFYILISIIALIDLYVQFEYDLFHAYFYSNVNTDYYQLYRTFFALRNLRMLVLFQGFTGLRRLIRVMVFAFPFLAKLLLILTITTISFALIGNNLYGHLESGNIIDEQINFKTFTSSLLTLLKCASGDNWRNVMTDAMYHNSKCTGDTCNSAYIYFILFIFLSNYVLLNLFVLGLIDQFEQFFRLQNSMIQVYIENIDHIKTVWCKYSYDQKGRSMHHKFLCKFLMDLGEPFVDVKENLWDMAKLTSRLKVRCDEHGYVYFNQLIYEVFRCTFKQQVFEQGSRQSIDAIKEYNREMQIRLYYYRRGDTRRSKICADITLRSNFNLLHDYLSVLIMFKAWEAYSKQLFENSINQREHFSEGSQEERQHNKPIESIWEVYSQEDESEELSKSSRHTEYKRPQCDLSVISGAEQSLSQLPYYNETLDGYLCYSTGYDNEMKIKNIKHRILNNECSDYIESQNVSVNQIM